MTNPDSPANVPPVDTRTGGSKQRPTGHHALQPPTSHLPPPKPHISEVSARRLPELFFARPWEAGGIGRTVSYTPRPKKLRVVEKALA